MGDDALIVDTEGMHSEKKLIFVTLYAYSIWNPARLTFGNIEQGFCQYVQNSCELRLNVCEDNINVFCMLQNR